MSKKAIVLASYGSMNLESYEETYEKIKRKYEEKFPDYEIYSTYNSKRIIAKMKRVHEISLIDLETQLKNLIAENYEEVYIQPIYITYGTEYSKLLDVFKEYEEKFLKINIGEPLLSKLEDYNHLVDIMNRRFSNENKCYLFIGHGTKDRNVASYGMLAYKLMLKSDNYFTMTIEDGVEFKEIEEKILDNFREVAIVPLMIVSGHHFNRDILEKIIPNLCEKGILADREVDNLLEIQGIAEIFVDHTKSIMIM